MTNERNRERALQAGEDAGFDPRSSSADLLDLVRSAEEDARLALRKRTPAVATALSAVARPAAEEEFVEVGDDAVEAPPSMPPMRTATPSHALDARALEVTAKRRPHEHVRPGLPPGLGILLILALAVGALAIVVR